MNLLEAARIAEGRESELGVQAVRVARAQENSPQPLQIGMLEQVLDHPLAEPLAAMRVDDKDVASQAKVARSVTIRAKPICRDSQNSPKQSEFLIDRSTVSRGMPGAQYDCSERNV